MNARQAKKARQLGRRYLRDMLLEIKNWPLRRRLWLAWKIVRGK